MTPADLRAAVTSARLRPRMYGPTPQHLAGYLHGMIAGAAPSGAAVNAAWYEALASPDPRAMTDAEACDAADATIAALWPATTGDTKPAGLDLAPIEARFANAACEVGDSDAWRSASDVPDLVARVRELEAQLAATEAEARVSLDALHARCDTAEAEVGRLRAQIAAAHGVTTPPTDDELSDDAATWIVTAPHSAGYAVRVLTSEDARRYRDTARGVHVWHLWDEATGCPAPRPAPSSAGTAAGERFAAEHPYAAGAMHGGIAHRSEVDK